MSKGSLRRSIRSNRVEQKSAPESTAKTPPPQRQKLLMLSDQLDKAARSSYPRLPRLQPINTGDPTRNTAIATLLIDMYFNRYDRRSLTRSDDIDERVWIAYLRCAPLSIVLVEEFLQSLERHFDDLETVRIFCLRVEALGPATQQEREDYIHAVLRLVPVREFNTLRRVVDVADVVLHFARIPPVVPSTDDPHNL